MICSKFSCINLAAIVAIAPVTFCQRICIFCPWLAPNSARRKIIFRRLSTILCGRLFRKPFENTIELREGLKSRSECDFADRQITISEQITRGGETSACDVLDKIYTRYLLETL